MMSVWLIALFSLDCFAGVVSGFEFAVPQSMKLHQQARSGDTSIVGITALGGGYINLYVRPRGEKFQPEDVFFNGVEVLQSPAQYSVGRWNWWMADARRSFFQRRGRATVYSTVFYSEQGDYLLFGNSRHADWAQAQVNAHRFLSTLEWAKRSLTGPEYMGKKYYLGWGAAALGDPSMMHNEVKYDVNHTHDIFTKDVGGNYLGATLIGPANATRASILEQWRQLAAVVGKDDMYVQYSSGHGSVSGLGVGVSYNEIRDHALSLPSQEVIIFIMACYSGNLVESFNAKKPVWEDWASQGRTLMVFASSRRSEPSSTGPGTDIDEANGPNGSAGSAFGFALWKSLLGYADGFVDGVKDGFLSLGEIEKYTIQKTYQVGGHRPVSTGVYDPGLIMNQVPPKELVERWESTRALSQAQLIEQIEALDKEMRVQKY